MKAKTIIVAGASGLVGKEVVKQLIADPHCKEIISLVRKVSETKHEKVKEVLYDYTKSEYELENVEADGMIICIGTTMKKVKTKERFKEVDLHIPVKLAKLAIKLDIQHIAVISAMGASPNSSFFYNRVKGEMEKQLIYLQLKNLTIVRPSLLIGDRHEFRFGEKLAEKIFSAMPFAFPKKYKPIESTDVARAMIKSIFHHSNHQVNIIENTDIHQLGRNS
ncbi:NAD(P)H-binding protein [Fictibacillus phosphorivorans]|uniref:NAD(P)H-binding protein n=1 Tax=Fictibacillus phosphorivorans TaxID=1221500 RepID=UPI0020424E36|nr:NAD(P)H-binding protein [Fictibacillus phosphorivorans]MCM3719640.1 NAD(P)H-binding protein [Fictibacillus phosphorivorans]MCM3777286.1 NAD(P)H-binding protein [Fictibacillus phosphorivorans]